jgi:hypothetical protein
MSKSPLRKDKTCLNCRYVVDQKFCPNCGQENTDTRKTFHHLFIHFFEDLTHYENAFWRTIRNLLFKPAALTKEYLSGKRLSYLAPVRLYIFISFITFLIIALFPNNESDLIHFDKKKSTTSSKNDSLKKATDTISDLDQLLTRQNDSIKYNVGFVDNEDNYLKLGYKSVQELDSIQQHAPKSKRLSDFSYWVNRKFQVVKDNNPKGELLEKFKESFTHNFSKVLFIYMPIFAFFLWLFHGKKRWYYFDHGIFTLHYFSFLLLISLILFLSNKLFSLFDSSLISFISGIFNFAAFCWMIYYFFPAHHRFYGETRFISFIKTMILFFINFFIITIILTLFAIYTFINLH